MGTTSSIWGVKYGTACNDLNMPALAALNRRWLQNSRIFWSRYRRRKYSLSKSFLSHWQYRRLPSYPQPQLNPALGIDSFLAAFAGRYKLVHKNHQLAIEKTGS